MENIAVIYWSQTGNTEAMANAIAEGINAAGAQAQLFTVSEITADKAAEYQKLALGCPAMGAEVLEESEFEPFFTELEGKLSGKKVLLFGSYGWGDGEWMRDWQDRTAAAGAILCGGEGLMAHETPDDDALASCRKLGGDFVSL
ncbi:flavodoxin [Harryflintia acetispora]|uniref:flavodoxin n=1 Tax=Harryflintia acetispora TaxID=1849041 RepID=UPI001896A749|nr:flavodoxin [Harryflintia acetispora]